MDPLLPDLGINVGNYVKEMATELANGIGPILGVTFAIIVMWTIVRHGKRAVKAK